MKTEELILMAILGAGDTRPWCLKFNGTNTTINSGSAASLDDIPAVSDLTVDGWIYISSDVGGAGIAAKGDGSITTRGWHIYTTGVGTVRIYVNHATSEAAAEAACSANAWAHFAGFYDQSAKKGRVAINGVWGTLGALCVGAYVSETADSLMFGSTALGKFNGRMGWMRLSNNDRYNGAAGDSFSPPSRRVTPALDANTVGLWPINEGTGSTADDISTNNNNGTIANGVWLRD